MRQDGTEKAVPGKAVPKNTGLANTGLANTDRQVVSVAGRRVTVTHLDKVLYPETGTTRAEVLRYYATVAPALLRHAAGRPVTRKRWVHGVGTRTDPGPMFFQKNLEAGAPDWVRHHPIRHRDHVTEYPELTDAAALVWFAQNGALEFHVPQWRWNDAGTALNPDRLVLDLDPGAGAGLPECAEVARLARSILTAMGLDPVPVTSGGAGLHLYAALPGESSSAEVSRVAHELARSLEADHPALVVSGMNRALRAGKVFVDWSQNSAAKTTITPYSLRGSLLPLVAAPRTWAELNSPTLAQLDYREVLHRLHRQGDLLGALARTTPRPTPPPLLLSTPPIPPLLPVSASVSASVSAAVSARQHRTEHRLEPYRLKRRAGRTPEPEGAGPGRPAAPEASVGRGFVIHEHHARRLHWDLRLEHDGVLVCWALPRGVPTQATHNRLAVHTEDHPVEYADFEGRIPAGEYGAGTMMIWDRGTYTIEKWRDAEVIVSLHGRLGGPIGRSRRFALIRTSPPDAATGEQWLMHLMKPTATDAAAVPQRAAADEAAPSQAAPPQAAPQQAAPPAPMLASPNTGSWPRNGQWAYEMKWDGMRALAVVTVAAPHPTATLFSRTGRDITATFPEIAADLLSRMPPGHTILDGEIVALDRTGRPDFGLLQRRLQHAATSARGTAGGTAGGAASGTAGGTAGGAATRIPVHYLLFDMLTQSGRSLLTLPYTERRRLLQSLFTTVDLSLSLSPSQAPAPAPASVQVPPGFIDDYAAALATSRKLGLEGIVAKDCTSPYLPGQRSPAWVKLRHTRSQEVVVGGWRPGRGHRTELGALLLGVPEPAGLRYIGRVGTGFRDRDLPGIRARLDELATVNTPFTDIPVADAADAHWVTPILVAEVEFTEWTAAGRLRHASWRGWRTDKTADEVLVEPS